MRVRRILPFAAILLALAQPAAAAPLERAACTALKTEREQLMAAGTKADMKRGPEWAKENLAPERLGQIERLIAVEEQLSFRCGEQVTARPAMKEPPKPKPKEGEGKSAAKPASEKKK